MPTGQLGALLISALGEIDPSGPFIVPRHRVGRRARSRARQPYGDYADADKLCIQNNGDADFINLAWPLGDATKPSTDMTPHDCAHPPLPEVVLP